MTLTPDDVYNATFRRPRLGKPGYDAYHVDGFLDRVEATLRGRDTLTAEDVLAATFPAQKRRSRAYAKDAVDAFLDQIALTLMRRTVRAHRGASRRTPPRPTRAPVEPMPMSTAEAGNPDAYDPAEVDAFIDRVYATLRGEDTITAQEVLSVRFSPAPPGQRGYHQAGVAAFLLLVASSLRQLAPRAQPLPVPHSTGPQGRALAQVPRLTSDEIRDLALNPPPPGEPGYHRREVDAFLARVEATLRGRDRLTAQDVHDVRFGEAIGNQGYDENEVEALLDLIEERLRLNVGHPGFPREPIRVG